MIAIKNLHKKFKDKVIFSGVDLDISKGELVMFLGQNGSGKTTLMKCLCGLLKFHKGAISLMNLEKNEIGLVLDENLLIPKLRVYEYLSLMLKLKCNIYNNQKVENYLKKIDLIEQKSDFIGALSKGSKSKLLLISALITEPKFVILDEPFRGMDLTAFEKAIVLIRNFNIEGGTVLLSTHRTDLIEALLPKIVVIKNKKIEKIKAGISESDLINYLKNAN